MSIDVNSASRRLDRRATFLVGIAVSALAFAPYAPVALRAQAADPVSNRPTNGSAPDGAGPTSAEPTVLGQARILLDARMPVTAASLLARALSTGEVEGDEAVLLTARAYADQRSWATARRLLAGRTFVGADAGREATLLLARAYSGLDSTSRAIDLYVSFVADSEGAPPLAVRTDLANAYGRIGSWSLAADQLRLAAAENPRLARWIDLSRLQALASAADTAAFALADSLDRAGRVPADSVLLPVARLAFESGDPERGTRIARSAGDGVWEVLAARHVAPHLWAAGDTAGAAAAFRTAIDAGRQTAATGPALLELDRSWRALRAVARSDMSAGRNERARGYLDEALALAPEDEKRGLIEILAAAHLALGAPRQAAQLLDPWTSPESTSAAPSSLWVLAARIFNALGEPAEADRAYERASKRSGGSAALAAYLIADAHQDAGRYAEAAEAFDHAYRSFPGSSYGSRSLERLALLAFHEGRFDDAQSNLDEYQRRYPRGSWATGALYWSGRTAEAKGDTAAAQTLYQRTVGRDPLTYYAILAAERASEDRWAVLALKPDQPLPDLHPAYAETLDRMNRLRDLGWVGRARSEYREGRGRGPSAPGQVLAFAHALNENGWTQEGIRQGWRAKSGHTGWTRSLLRAIYPLPFRMALTNAAHARDLPPHFVAGLSRRESMFDPEIMSAANAVGLMQLLPRTARDVSARAGLPEYRRSQLTVPQVNLLLGTRYLADVLGRFDGSPVAGMISYNAGPHRYTRWRELREFEHPEQLVERIPFRETREYVRAVSELTEIYRFLYPSLEAPTP